MPEEPGEETFSHHQPLDSRPTVVRPRLSRGWEYDFYTNGIGKKANLLQRCYAMDSGFVA